MFIQKESAGIVSTNLLTPSLNGLSDTEEAEFQNLSAAAWLNSKERHRFRLLRAKRWRPDKNRQDVLHKHSEQMDALLREIVEKFSGIYSSPDWKDLMAKVRDVVSENKAKL